MFDKIVKAGFLAVLVVCFMAGNVLRAEVKTIEEMGKKIIVEAEGKLTWVKMTNFPDNPWKELTLVDAQENIIAILIGAKVGEILEKEGETVKVKGLLKPEMAVQAKKVPVIEIQEFKLLSEEIEDIEEIEE